MLIDCKTCSTHLFSIKRIEQNQRLAFKRFKKCENDNYFLAIKSNGNIYMINLKLVDFSKKYIDLENEYIL